MILLECAYCHCIDSVHHLISTEELHENIRLNAKRMSTADTGVNIQTGDKSKEEFDSERTPVSRETWISFEDFCVCFQ